MKLSVILPVYNGADYIAENANMISHYLEDHYSGNHELIIVNDGSNDKTSAVLLSLPLPGLKIITLSENHGKFAAIVSGMKEATGDCRIFTDADIPYDLEIISYIEKIINKRSFHVVIGDRTLPGAEYSQNVSTLRFLLTYIFTNFIRIFVAGGLFDTQCGVKGFRGDVAKAIFPLLLDHSFSGDVELLYISLKYNLEIKRIPVRLRRSAPSSVRIFRHGLQMLHSISILKRNWKAGLYQSPELTSISSQQYWNTP